MCFYEILHLSKTDKASVYQRLVFGCSEVLIQDTIGVLCPESFLRYVGTSIGRRSGSCWRRNLWRLNHLPRHDEGQEARIFFGLEGLRYQGTSVKLGQFAL